jgi:hypothetical protein
MMSLVTISWAMEVASTYVCGSILWGCIKRDVARSKHTSLFTFFYVRNILNQSLQPLIAGEDFLHQKKTNRHSRW